GEGRHVDQFEGQGGGGLDQQQAGAVGQGRDDVGDGGVGGVEVGGDAARLQVAVEEAAGGAVEGVGRQDRVAGTEQGGQGHGDGGEAGRDQPGLGRALQIGEGGAQLAGGGQVLDAVDRSGALVPHGRGIVVEQGRG